MIFIFLCPITFLLGWVSLYTVLIDRILIGTFLFVFGFTPLLGIAIFRGGEGADFHNRDFIGPWMWVFDKLDAIAQVALMAGFLSYFFGKLVASIYIVSNRD